MPLQLIFPAGGFAIPVTRPSTFTGAVQFWVPGTTGLFTRVLVLPVVPMDGRFLLARKDTWPITILVPARTRWETLPICWIDTVTTDPHVNTRALRGANLTPLKAVLSSLNFSSERKKKNARCNSNCAPTQYQRRNPVS